MLRKSNNNRIWFQVLSKPIWQVMLWHTLLWEWGLSWRVCVCVCTCVWPIGEHAIYIPRVLPKTNKQRNLSVHCFSLYITTLHAYWSNMLQWQSSFIPLGFLARHLIRWGLGVWPPLSCTVLSYGQSMLLNVCHIHSSVAYVHCCCRRWWSCSCCSSCCCWSAVNSLSTMLQFTQQKSLSLTLRILRRIGTVLDNVKS